MNKRTVTVLTFSSDLKEGRKMEGVKRWHLRGPMDSVQVVYSHHFRVVYFYFVFFSVSCRTDKSTTDD